LRATGMSEEQVKEHVVQSCGGVSCRLSNVQTGSQTAHSFT
jgi:hypothetical protein